jgi:Flp pilus assembly protein TadG
VEIAAIYQFLLKEVSRRDESNCNFKEIGTSVVEFALVVPILIMLLFGIFELNVGLYSVHNVTQNLSDSVRAGAIAQDDASADRKIFDRIFGSTPPGATVEAITIYRAENFDSPPPVPCAASCTTYSGATLSGTFDAYTWCSSENGTCTFSGTKLIRYGKNSTWTYKTFTNTTGCNNVVFGDPLVGTVKECGVQNLPACVSYCPPDRRPYELLGVAVKMKYSPITKFIPLSYTYERHAVVPIEPRVV